MNSITFEHKDSILKSIINLTKDTPGTLLPAENHRERWPRFELLMNPQNGIFYSSTDTSDVLIPITFSYQRPQNVILEANTLYTKFTDQALTAACAKILLVMEKVLSTAVQIELYPTKYGFEEALTPPNAQPEYGDPFWTRDMTRFKGSINAHLLKNVTKEKIDAIFKELSIITKEEHPADALLGVPISPPLYLFEGRPSLGEFIIYENDHEDATKCIFARVIGFTPASVIVQTESKQNTLLLGEEFMRKEITEDRIRAKLFY